MNSLRLILHMWPATTKKWEEDTVKYVITVNDELNQYKYIRTIAPDKKPNPFCE